VLDDDGSLGAEAAHFLMRLRRQYVEATHVLSESPQPLRAEQDSLPMNGGCVVGGLELLLTRAKPGFLGF